LQFAFQVLGKKLLIFALLFYYVECCASF
jgi:hypothetical protein